MNNEELQDRLKRLAKVAAAIDSREGGHRVGLNIANTLTWALNWKLEHQTAEGNLA